MGEMKNSDSVLQSLLIYEESYKNENLIQNIQNTVERISKKYPPDFRTEQRDKNIQLKKYDIEFKNLSYTIKTGLFKLGTKTILNNINGNFKAGDLTAILGPSGAGKTTLLHILSGYITHNFTGEITINKCTRDAKEFSPLSAYITQDTELQPQLTVIEAMSFSANLKLGNTMSQKRKKERVQRILNAIGMDETQHTRTKNLSGGQKKRLSIALELVSNPPLLFLDEPTSGLDSSASVQCISLLKMLAEKGRTIICTIHQPSAKLFQEFDHLFTIAEGRCIFSGATQNVVSFLAELNLNCPEYYNPSDYLLEISTNDYGYENDRLVQKIQNGCSEIFRKKREMIDEMEVLVMADKIMTNDLITPLHTPNLETIHTLNFKRITEKKSIFSFNDNDENLNRNINLKVSDSTGRCGQYEHYSSSICKQIFILLVRTFLVHWRDYFFVKMQIIAHFVMAVFVGLLYYGIGNEASHTLNNFRYIFFSTMFLMFSAFSATILVFPLEFTIVSREHFNRWYSLRAYYICLTLADLPLQFICISTFIAISYPMTKQPLEFYRITSFFIICFMTNLVSQSFGLVIGATMSIKNGAIIGPLLILPFLLFSGFFVQIRDAHKYMQWLFHISFMKHSLEGSVTSIFGNNRAKMTCNEIFCMYTWPKRFLEDIGMQNGSILYSSSILVIIFLVLRIIAFVVIANRLRLNR